MIDGHVESKPDQADSHRQAPTRIFTLIDHPAVGGGAERVALELIAALDGSRFRRTLCLTRWAPENYDAARLASFTDALSRSGVGLLALRRRGPAGAGTWLALARTLRRERVDILHTHKFGSNVWGCLIGRLAGVPVIVSHEHTWSYEGRPLRRVLDRHLIARLSDVFIAVSPEDRRRMLAIERISPDDVVELRNALGASPAGVGRAEMRRRLELPPEAPIVGIVAVQRPQKRIDLLVRAAVRLRSQFPGLRVLLIGGGTDSEQARIEALVEELGLGATVISLGMRDDVPELLGALDVAVLCSDFEGSPLAAIEYMAAGLPIVATAVGGLPDLLDGGRCGVLVPPGDERELAAAIAGLLADRDHAQRLGELARERRLSEFGLGPVVDRLEGIYERSLVRRRRRELTIERLDGFGAASEVWDSLAERHGGPFARRAFNEAWWTHLGSGELRLFVCRRPGGEPVAVLPLRLTRRGSLRVLRFLGGGPFDEMGPVCAPEDRPLALAALRAEIDRGGLGADLLLAERVPASADVGNALGGRVVNRDASPSVAIGGLTWDGFLAQRSRNFREQARRRERTLLRDHGARFRLCDDPIRLGTDMATLFALHHARWGDGSAAFTPQREALHRDVAAAALREGWLRLWMLEIDGDAVAAWYGFRSGRREWYYQAGRDPSWERSSVGFVLMNHTIREAIGDGLGEYRLLRGDEGYKSRFATHTDELQTRVVAGTASGRIAAAALSGAANRPWVRSQLKRFDR